MPWPDAAPQNKKLELFVRYVAPDGRKLVSEMTISVNPPAGNQAKRWRTSAGNTSAQRNATAQNVRAHDRFSRSGSDRGSRDSEAPRFSAASPSGGATTLPNVELGEEGAEMADSDDPAIVADDERPAAVARRPTSDRQSGRPAWTPYR